MVGLNSSLFAQVCSYIDHLNEAHFRKLCNILHQSIFHYILLDLFDWLSPVYSLD
jgi:hypothetical protein